MAYMAAKDKDGQAIKKNDNVFYNGKIWAVDAVSSGNMLHLTCFGDKVTVESVKVTKYR